MASMRVHELAKEFDMSSGDLLDRLKEMKIPAKSHASMLNDAYVDKIRKNLEPEIRARAGALEAEEAAALAAEQEEAERKRAEEEAERKAAREKELAEREAARARREGSRSDNDAEGEEHPARKQAPKQPSAFDEPRAADRLGEGARRARAPGGPGPRPRREGGRRGGQEARRGRGPAPRPQEAREGRARACPGPSGPGSRAVSPQEATSTRCSRRSRPRSSAWRRPRAPRPTPAGPAACKKGKKGGRVTRWCPSSRPR